MSNSRHALVAAFLALAPLTAAVAADAVYAFNLPSEDLGTALRAFARTTKQQVVFDSAVVKGLRSAPVTGSYGADDAARQLLGNNALTLRRTESGVLVVEGVRKQSADAAVRSTQVAQAEPMPQDRGMRLEEIVVTAQKREERLQDVPVSVAVVATETLVQMGQLRVQDYYRTVPGVNLTLAGNGGEPLLNIRGIASANNGPVVGIVIDDLPYGNSISAALPMTIPDFDPGDLARIEVLRGPQGTLYGASSIGGLINFVTVDPSMDGFSGQVQVGTQRTKYNSELGHTFRGSVNVPVGETLALRLSGFGLREPGSVSNVTTGAHSNRDAEGGRASVLWAPSDDFSLKLGAMIQRSERVSSETVDLTLVGNPPRQRAPAGVGLYIRNSEIYSALAKYRYGDVELTSVTGYTKDRTRSQLDLAGVEPFVTLARQNFGVTGVAVPADLQSEKFSQELRLATELSDNIEWQLGAFYTEEDISATATTAAVNPATGAFAGALLQTDLPIKYKELAGFTNLTVHITDQFDVQAGARIARIRQEFQNIRTGAAVLTFFPTNPFVSPIAKPRSEPFTYLFTPRYKVSEELMLYARFASGFRPGGPNAAVGQVNVPATFQPDRTYSYELGAKGNLLDGVFSYEASLYSIDWRDIQTRVNIVGASSQYTANAGKARSRGIELSGQVTPAEGLTLSGWVSYNDADLRETFAANVTNFRGFKGEQLPYTTAWSAYFAIDKAFAVTDEVEATVGLSISHTGDQINTFNLGTAPRFITRPNTLVDAKAGLDYDTWGLDLYVTNITNERAQLTPTIANRTTYSKPRTAGVTLTKSSKFAYGGQPQN